MKLTAQSSNEEMMRELGSRIRETRIDMGLTQNETARKAGVTTKTISRIENGEYLTVSTLLAKHDFSRPVIPDCALYLRKVYNHLCEEYGADTVKSWHIVTKDRSEDKRLSTKELSSEANDLLVRAGYVGRLSSSGRPDENQEPIPIRLLISTYRRRLRSDAGLASDGDTYNFLCGTLQRSSTFTNYESHTPLKAQYRLYKVLLPISVKKRLTSKSGLQTTKEGTAYLATPKTNHEVAQLTGTIDLEPGQSITIRVPSGVNGPIDITYHGRAKKDVFPLCIFYKLNCTICRISSSFCQIDAPYIVFTCVNYAK